MARARLSVLSLLPLLGLLAMACDGKAEAEAAAATSSTPEGGNRSADEGTAPSAVPPSPSASLAPDEHSDLEAMCAAVDHDYIDGTLTDYFAGLESSSAWGKSLQAKADESTTPGRSLAAAAQERGVGGEALPPSCRKLFDYLDDVE